MRIGVIKVSAKSVYSKALIAILVAAVGCQGAETSILQGEVPLDIGEMSVPELHQAYLDTLKDPVGQNAIKRWMKSSWSDLATETGRSAGAGRSVALKIGDIQLVLPGLTGSSSASSQQFLKSYKNVGELLKAYNVDKADITPENIARSVIITRTALNMSDATLQRLSKAELNNMAKHHLILLETIGVLETMSNQPKLGFFWFIPMAIGAAAVSARLGHTAARLGKVASEAGKAGARGLKTAAESPGGKITGNTLKAAEKKEGIVQVSDTPGHVSDRIEADQVANSGAN